MRAVHEQCVDCDDGRPTRADVGGILTKLYLSHAREGKAKDGFVKINVHAISLKDLLGIEKAEASWVVKQFAR